MFSERFGGGGVGVEDWSMTFGFIFLGKRKTC